MSILYSAITINITINVVNATFNKTEIFQTVEIILNAYFYQNDIKYQVINKKTTENTNIVIVVGLENDVNLERDVLKKEMNEELKRQYPEGTVSVVEIVISNDDKEEEEDRVDQNNAFYEEWWYVLYVLPHEYIYSVFVVI